MEEHFLSQIKSQYKDKPPRVTCVTSFVKALFAFVRTIPNINMDIKLMRDVGHLSKITINLKEDVHFQQHLRKILEMPGVVDVQLFFRPSMLELHVLLHENKEEITKERLKISRDSPVYSREFELSKKSPELGSQFHISETSWQTAGTVLERAMCLPKIIMDVGEIKIKVNDKFPRTRYDLFLQLSADTDDKTDLMLGPLSSYAIDNLLNQHYPCAHDMVYYIKEQHMHFVFLADPKRFADDALSSDSEEECNPAKRSRSFPVHSKADNTLSRDGEGRENFVKRRRV